MLCLLHGLVLQSLGFQLPSSLMAEKMLAASARALSSPLPPPGRSWKPRPRLPGTSRTRLRQGLTSQGDEEMEKFLSMAETLLRQNDDELDSLSFGRKWKAMFPDKDLDPFTRGRRATVAQLLSSSDRFSVSKKPNSAAKIFRLKDSQRSKTVEKKDSTRGYAFSVVKTSDVPTGGGLGESEFNATRPKSSAFRASESALKLMDAWSQAATSANSSTQAEKEERSLNLMKQVGNVTSVQFYNRMIRQYVESVSEGDKMALFKALDALAEMRRKNLEVNLLTVNSVLTVCKKAASTDQMEEAVNAAFQIFEDMKSMKLPPDLVTFNLLLETCSNAIECGYAECFDKASSVFDKMQEYQIKPNVASYNMLLFSCSRAARDSGPLIISKCFHILDLMEEDGLLPDTSVFNAMIDACAKSATGNDGVSVGLQILERMSANRIEPDVITYNSLINVCAMSAADGDTNAFANAQEILYMMLKNGVR